MRIWRLYIVVSMLLVCGVSMASTVSQSFADMSNVEEERLSQISAEELWSGANTAYANGNYIDAEQRYNEILSRGVHSAELYYNLGNLYHKKREVALSLLNYYRALRLNPSDSDTKHNIEVVRSETKDNIEQMPRLFLIEWSEWLGRQLSYIEWSIMSLLMLAVALAALMVYLLAESLRWRRVGFWGAVVVGLICAVATSHALSERANVMSPREAIVMSRSLSVKSSPSNATTELFILHEGTKVEVLSRHETWSEIVIADGKKGWVESRQIESI